MDRIEDTTIEAVLEHLMDDGAGGDYPQLIVQPDVWKF
jgi:hypothetical protein